MQLPPAITDLPPRRTENMRTLFTGTIAALVLGAAVASSQTPPPAQTPPAAQTPSAQTPPSQPPAQAKPAEKTTTYRGFLRGSDASGWTISPIADRPASAAPGATATAGAVTPSGPTYSVIAPAVSKVKLSDMADQCVEIVGVLAPEGAVSSGAGAAASPGMPSKATRALNVTAIREVQGGCTQ